jgi:hypothetical protein
VKFLGERRNQQHETIQAAAVDHESRHEQRSEDFTAMVDRHPPHRTEFVLLHAMLSMAGRSPSRFGSPPD